MYTEAQWNRTCRAYRRRVAASTISPSTQLTTDDRENLRMAHIAHTLAVLERRETP
jgi:hypothetical protein